MSQRLLTVSEAADRLGVAPRRVRALAQAGQLTAVRTGSGWLVDVDSVARRAVMNELGIADASTRPWNSRLAWAAMRALDGDDRLLDALDPKSRHRVRRRLDSAAPARLLAVVRDRACVHRVTVHPSRVDRLRELVVPSGVAGAGIHGHGLTGDKDVDGYLAADDLTAARAAVPIRDSETGTHLLRVVDDSALLDGLEVSPRLAVAADLLDHAIDAGRADGRVVSAIRVLLGAIDTASVAWPNVPSSMGPPP